MASGYIKSIHCIIYRYNLQSSSVLWAGSGVVAQAWNPKAISVLNWSPCLDIFLMDVPGRSPQSQSPGTEGHTKVAKFCCLDSQITGVCLRFQCILVVHDVGLGNVRQSSKLSLELSPHVHIQVCHRAGDVQIPASTVSRLGPRQIYCIGWLHLQGSYHTAGLCSITRSPAEGRCRVKEASLNVGQASCMLHMHKIYVQDILVPCQ